MGFTASGPERRRSKRKAPPRNPKCSPCSKHIEETSVPNRRRRKLSTAMSAVAAVAVASPVALVAMSQLSPAPQEREFTQAALVTDLPGELMSALSQGLSQFGINLPPMPNSLLTGSSPTPTLGSPTLTSPGLASQGLTAPGLTPPGGLPGQGLTAPGLASPDPTLTSPNGLSPTAGSPAGALPSATGSLTDPALSTRHSAGWAALAAPRARCRSRLRSGSTRARAPTRSWAPTRRCRRCLPPVVAAEACSVICPARPTSSARDRPSTCSRAW